MRSSSRSSIKRKACWLTKTMKVNTSRTISSINRSNSSSSSNSSSTSKTLVAPLPRPPYNLIRLEMKTWTISLKMITSYSWRDYSLRHTTVTDSKPQLARITEGTTSDEGATFPDLVMLYEMKLVMNVSCNIPKGGSVNSPNTPIFTVLNMYLP